MKRKSFKEVSTLWEADRSKVVKPTSMAAYSLIIRNHLAPRFEWLDEITPESVQELADEELKKGNGITTVKGIVLVLKMIVRYCEKQGWMAMRIYDINLPKKRKKPNPQVLAVEDEKRLIGWLKEHRTLRNIGLMICLCCGLRIGEVCALKWGDVDSLHNVIHVRRTLHRVYLSDRKPHKSELTIGVPKTEESCREVPLTEVLANELIRTKNETDPSDDIFILSGNTKPIDPQTFRNHFRSVTDELGLPPRKIHSLRHTFATRCVESKCDFKTLSALLGHADIATTMNLYVHPGLEQKRRCVEDMMKLF